MLLLALSVAGCAAYFSICGLSQLFAGASVAVIIMASVLEVGKIITTTALHTYWDYLARPLKIYLTISVGVLMIITSAGIYGFLSNAYQKTANKLEMHDGEVGVLNGKKEIFDNAIKDNKEIIDTKNKRIDQLSNLRINQENRIDQTKGNRNKDKVRKDIEGANIEIQKLSSEIDLLNAKNMVLSDSVSKYNVSVLGLKSSSDVAGEVGPLKYVSALTGIPMANVVNYMILLLIFVFDPLAIALVLVTNKVFELEGRQTPLEPKKEYVTEQTTSIVKVNDGYDNDDYDSDESLEDVYVRYDDLIGLKNKEVIVNEISEEESKVVSESQIEVPVYKKEPVIPTGKIEVEDIKEIKENRGYSVPIPKNTNTIERIGSNKHIKDGDNNRFFFKRK